MIRRWGQLFSVALLVLSLAGCTENRRGVNDDGDNGPNDGEVDHSTVTFTDFTFKGYDADGTIETGLELHWGIVLHSSTGRDLRVVDYKLLDSGGGMILKRDDPLPEFAHDGEILYDKESWIAIDGPTSAGDYRFSISYQLGELLTDHMDNERWQGPIESGALDTTFTVVP